MAIATELGECVELCSFGDAYKLMYQPKLSRGDEMVDIRMWIRWNTDHLFHPSTKRSLFVRRDAFEATILPKLNELFHKSKDSV